MSEKERDDFIESKEFYDLMQLYRHAPISDQIGVVVAFESVKQYVRKGLTELQAQLAEANRQRDAAIADILSLVETRKPLSNFEPYNVVAKSPKQILDMVEKYKALGQEVKP